MKVSTVFLGLGHHLMDRIYKVIYAEEDWYGGKLNTSTVYQRIDSEWQQIAFYEEIPGWTKFGENYIDEELKKDDSDYVPFGHKWWPRK